MKIKKIDNPKYETDEDNKYVCVDCDYIISSQPVYIITVGKDYQHVKKVDYDELGARRFGIANKHDSVVVDTVQFVLCESAFNRLITKGSDMILQEADIPQTITEWVRLAEHTYGNMSSDAKKAELIAKLCDDFKTMEKPKFQSKYKEAFHVSEVSV